MPVQLLRRGTSVVALTLTVLAGSALLPAPARASTVLFRTDAELVVLSERVVHARVLRQRSERPRGASGSIYTVTTLAVLEDFTGVAGQTIEVWELGGVFGDEGMWVGGAVTYDIGSQVLVCLERGPFGLRSVAMGFSKFDVEPIAAADGTSNGRLTRSMRDTAVAGGPAVRAQERTLAEFRALTSRVRGVRSVRNAGAGQLQPEYEVTAGFTFLGPARWIEADSGAPVNWHINTSAPSPLMTGDGVLEFQRALSAWTAPASASLVLRYNGTTLQNAPNGSTGDADGPWNGIASTGNGVITFEDPYGQMSGSTLALGGGYMTNGGGTVNGTVFRRFTRGYVLFQNALELPASYRQSQNYARVLEHEIGHAIGLGHSAEQTAIMYPSCCSGSTPIAPNLGPDDLAGLNFIYPSRTAVAGDYDGDRAADLVLFRPGTGSWMTRLSSQNFATGTNTVFGLSTDKPLPGDYDGDGRLDLAVYRPSNGTWYLIYSSIGTVVQVEWGMGTDIPVPADYTGDGRTDLAVWRPSNGTWYIFDLSTGTYTSRQWGHSTDVPLTGDYDGDGKADVVVFRPSSGNWYVFHSSTQTHTVHQWGHSTDVPVPADYSGDGRTEIAVYRPSNGTWYVYDPSTSAYVLYQWGWSTDIPAPKDYDGDGRTDLAVWRPSSGTWFIFFVATNTFRSVTHGASGDIPIR